MGIPLNDEKTLYTLFFADDQILLAQDQQDLEYMTRKLIEEYEKWGLELNIAKTQRMSIGGTREDVVLEDGRVIKDCEEYKYLGLKITRDGLMDEGIKERVVLGRKAISMLNGVVWDQRISKDNKKRIYNTIVRSMITYGSEVWRLKKRMENVLLATEMDFWRRAAGRSRTERIRNERIRDIMGIKHTIVDDIRTKQLVWFGHVQRMPEDRIPKQTLLWKPLGRNRRGRPRLSWREGIDRELRDRDIPEDLWTNREEWRLGVGKRRRTF
ncbi:uncharacterized protein LOC123318297 [Coccinella septempunctata]|uniref:uncharacterized protein LOC123318297 n=1 Tax=Coccinella septempunctata TaxID=41139 RepID=UPI001D08EEBF|nr:uncharacterized protein LOC123318297 [Coccinella septempunctata]